MGKTRLAQHVAEQLAPRFQDGAVFVDLAPVEQAEMVMPTLCEALGVQDASSTASRLALLQAFIQKKHLLIVLDNFEQVLPAAKLLTSLLAGAPRVRMLVTSREALRIAGEHGSPAALRAAWRGALLGQRHRRDSRRAIARGSRPRRQNQISS